MRYTKRHRRKTGYTHKHTHTHKHRGGDDNSLIPNRRSINTITKDLPITPDPTEDLTVPSTEDPTVSTTKDQTVPKHSTNSIFYEIIIAYTYLNKLADRKLWIVPKPVGLIDVSNNVHQFNDKLLPKLPLSIGNSNVSYDTTDIADDIKKTIAQYTNEWCDKRIVGVQYEDRNKAIVEDRNKAISLREAIRSRRDQVIADVWSILFQIYVMHYYLPEWSFNFTEDSLDHIMLMPLEPNTIIEYKVSPTDDRKFSPTNNSKSVLLVPTQFRVYVNNFRRVRVGQYSTAVYEQLRRVKVCSTSETIPTPISKTIPTLTTDPKPEIIPTAEPNQTQPQDLIDKYCFSLCNVKNILTEVNYDITNIVTAIQQVNQSDQSWFAQVLFMVINRLYTRYTKGILRLQGRFKRRINKCIEMLTTEYNNNYKDKNNNKPYNAGEYASMLFYKLIDTVKGGTRKKGGNTRKRVSIRKILINKGRKRKTQTRHTSKGGLPWSKTKQPQQPQQPTYFFDPNWTKNWTNSRFNSKFEDLRINQPEMAKYYRSWDARWLQFLYYELYPNEHDKLEPNEHNKPLNGPLYDLCMKQNTSNLEVYYNIKTYIMNKHDQNQNQEPLFVNPYIDPPKQSE
jgi:hypothetical protein